MIYLLTLLHLLSADPADVASLRDSATDCTFVGSPATHLATAEVVAQVFDIDATLLLSIAHHESCFSNVVVTGRASGVMQTITARPPETLIEGYTLGAAEIRSWLVASHGSMRVALAGYSGGWATFHACREGRDCGYADWFLSRAARLKKGLHHGLV